LEQRKGLMTAMTASSSARHLHLMRAAQSAGEAFGCHVVDQTPGAGAVGVRSASLGALLLVLLTAAAAYFVM
jgi:hypothetical protein